MNKFNPSDYIVTRDGFRGYVVDRLKPESEFYIVRTTSGCTVYNQCELEIDLMMYKEMVDVCDISK